MKGLNIMKVAGRSILVDEDGAPVTIGIVTRESTTAPGRVKAVLVADFDGVGVPLPFAQNVIGATGGFTPEFRLEQN